MKTHQLFFVLAFGALVAGAGCNKDSTEPCLNCVPKDTTSRRDTTKILWTMGEKRFFTDLAVAEGEKVVVVGNLLTGCGDFVGLFDSAGSVLWIEEWYAGSSDGCIGSSRGPKVVVHNDFAYVLRTRNTANFLISYIYLDKRELGRGELVDSVLIAMGSLYSMTADGQHIYVSGVGIPTSTGGGSRCFILKVRPADLKVVAEADDGLCAPQMAVKDSTLYADSWNSDGTWLAAFRTTDLSEKWFRICCGEGYSGAGVAATDSVVAVFAFGNRSKKKPHKMAVYDFLGNLRKEVVFPDSVYEVGFATSDGAYIYMSAGPLKITPSGDIVWRGHGFICRNGVCSYSPTDGLSHLALRRRELLVISAEAVDQIVYPIIERFDIATGKRVGSSF
jgi:hypothetical protein